MKSSFITSDKGVLLINILFAFVLWFMVQMGHEYSATEYIDLSYSIDKDKVFAKTPPKEIKLDILATGWNLVPLYFSKKKNEINIDVHNKDNLIIDNSIISSYISNDLLSERLKISKIYLQYFQSDIVPKAKKVVPIIPDTDLSFGEDIQLKENPILIPDSIELTGAESILKSIYNISTEKLTKKNILKGFHSSIDLQIPNDVSANIHQVEITFEVEQLTEKSVYIPIEVINSTDSIEITPTKSVFTAKIGLSKYDHLSGSDFRLVADFKNSTSNIIPLTLVSKPSYISNYSVSPDFVEFILIKTNSKH